MMIRVAEWLPDLPDIENPGSTLARNVVPKTALSYGPWKQPEALSTNSVDSRPLGAFSASDYSGTVFTFCGDAGKLYRYSGSTLTDVSKLGGYTSVSGFTDKVGRAWRFEQYNNLVIGTNFADPVQKWALGTDSAFTDLAATAPKARYAAVVGEHLVLANTDDTFDGHVGLRLWFGPIGSPTTNDWGNTNLLSDFRTLPRGGEITGIAGGEYGIVFCRNATYRMTFTGTGTIFSIDEINENHGCIAPGSLAQNENLVFYLAADGFQMMQGDQSSPIGQDKVDDTFFNELDSGNMGRIVSTIDPERKLYLVAYPTVESADGTPNKILAYNYYLGRWSEIEEEVEIIDSLRGAAFSLEDVAAIHPVIDDVPGSYENPAFIGGATYLAGLMKDRSLQSFNGPNKGFQIETSEAQLSPNMRSVLRKCRPLTDCDCPQISIGARDRQSDAVTYSAAVSPNAETHICSFRVKGRYHRARISAPNGWQGSEVTGIDGLEFNSAGMR